MDETNTNGPAYLVRSARLVIRCWTPADAPLMKVALDASREHLRPWLSWVGDPQTIEQHVDRARKNRGEFDLDRDYVYAILNPTETEVLGGTGLHKRIGPMAREIGYWIHALHINRGLATESSAALTRVAFEVDGVHRVEIRCDPRNQRSAAVPRKLGFVHEATLRQNHVNPDGTARDTMVWAMVRSEYPTSVVARAELTAFDSVGRRLL